MRWIFSCLLFLSSLQAKETADYIVIGLGTAGAAMAKLLTDNNASSVIALHNGPNLSNDPEIKYTKNVLFTVVSILFDSPLYETSETSPQTFADNTVVRWGIALPAGGATSINAGAWCRGTNEVYSQWEAIAGPDWSTTRIQDLYVSLENYTGHTTDPSARGLGGPITIRQNPSPTSFAIKLSNALLASNPTLVPVEDYNDPNTTVAYSNQVQYSQSGDEGQLRESSANIFLNTDVAAPDGKGVHGRRLNIKYNTMAMRTIWNGNTAVGVEYFQNGKIKKVYANKGVIVCAGLRSSAFLMQSGVGPASKLHALGIPVKVDNPNVGQSLTDQPQVAVVFTSNPDDTPVTFSSCGYYSKRHWH